MVDWARASSGTAQLPHSNSKRRHSLDENLMTLFEAWMRHTTWHTVTVAVNFGSKVSQGNFFERGRTSGRPAVCEADTEEEDLIRTKNINSYQVLLWLSWITTWKRKHAQLNRFFGFLEGFQLFECAFRSNRTAETLLQDPQLGSDQQVEHTPTAATRVAPALPAMYKFQWVTWRR